MSIPHYTFYNALRALLNDRSGATAMEYGLLVALVSTGIMFGASGMGGSMGEMFGRVEECLEVLPSTC